MIEPALRHATHDDLDWIAGQEVEIFGPRAWSRSLIGEDLKRAFPRSYRIVEADGERIGYAVFGFDGDAFTLMNIAVIPRWRRKGVGSMIVDAFLSDAKDLRVSEVWLEVAADNLQAVELYRRFGFERVRIRPRYYQPGDIDAVVMRKPILGPPE